MSIRVTNVGPNLSFSIPGIGKKLDTMFLESFACCFNVRHTDIEKRGHRFAGYPVDTPGAVGTYAGQRLY